MTLLHLGFESGEDSLSVRRFAVREAISSLFEVTIEAVSPSEELDLCVIVGRGASFQLSAGPKLLEPGARLWTGVCNHIEQAEVEPTGLSTYHLRIVPRLWLLTQRRNHRAFQHLSIPEIVDRLLAEWRIEPRWKIDREAHPRLELRTQYGESDYAFLSRLLEEAGITFYFEHEAGGDGRLVLHDRPHLGEPRSGGPVSYLDKPDQAAGRAHVRRVRLAHDVQPGRFAIRDVDPRRRHDYPLLAEASAGDPVEDLLEQYHYLPGAFLVEGGTRGDTPVADDLGVARHDERAGKLLAERSLEATRAARRMISFETNLVELSPGVVFSIDQHPRADLGADRKLLVTELSIEGTPSEEWKTRGRAVFAEVPYRPARRTPKPQIHSVQGAVVVGPKGEEIHTDEFGRVRVQFSWDREGRFDEHSSCWIRVSQGWAGGAYGMIALPRVGQEVLVGFLEGDPDQPIIVGRVYNNTTRVPYKLPENKTVSTWKSSSSPGSNGFNEIMFEDARGQERLFVQAERDLEVLVKADESLTVGGHRKLEVGASESVAVGLSQTLTVGEGRTVSVGGDDETSVGGRYAVSVTPSAEASGVRLPTGFEVADRKITLTTGEATITLEGPNITLDAAASILLNAAASITIHGRADIHLAAGANVSLKARDGDLVVQGGPNVLINPSAVADDPGELPVEAPPGLEMDDDVLDAEDGALFEPSEPAWLQDQLAPGGRWDPLRWGPEHEDFGYFHLGVMAAAAGIPLGVMMRSSLINLEEFGGAWLGTALEAPIFVRACAPRPCIALLPWT